MAMTNVQAANYLLNNIFCYQNYIPDFNTAVLKGAAALTLAGEDEVDELCEKLWKQLFVVNKKQFNQEREACTE